MVESLVGVIGREDRFKERSWVSNVNGDELAIGSKDETAGVVVVLVADTYLKPWAGPQLVVVVWYVPEPEG